MGKKILISGGSGLLGRALSDELLKNGHEVAWLSRTPGKYDKIKAYKWDIKSNTIDEGALNWADTIVHLAGAGVAEERWTDSRKEVILKSRTESTRLLFEKIQSLKTKPTAFLSASAIGFYGFDTGDHWMTEADDPKARDFISGVVRAWENEVDHISKLGIRTVKIRIGIVLSEKGGALEKMLPVFKLGAGAPLGDGRQYMSWIHIHDLCHIFLEAIENEFWQGVYNGVAPNPVTNKTFSKTLAKTLNKPFFLPNVPSIALHLAMGEMSKIVLGGNRVSSNKVLEEGFDFKFEQLDKALSDLL
jgi:uncharacterized protein (TIGR01777 family)